MVEVIFDSRYIKYPLINGDALSVFFASDRNKRRYRIKFVFLEWFRSLDKIFLEFSFYCYSNISD